MSTNTETTIRKFRLSDEDWDALERIAVRLGLDWGGIPSRSEAVRFLIREWMGREGRRGRPERKRKFSSDTS